MATPRVLNADELNAIAAGSGYKGGTFSNVGLAPSPGSRNLNMMAGNDTGTLQQGQVQSQGVGQSAGGVDQFNNAIMGLMQKYQQMGTKKFATQGLDAQQEQTNRISAQTSPDLMGADPGLQNSTRNAFAGALDPTIRSASQSQQTFGEQLNSFGNAVDSARSFVKDYQANQDKTRDDARSVINNAFTIGGADSLKGLDSTEIAQLEKTAGYPKGYIEGVSKTIKERELELKRQTSAQNASLTNGLSAANINTTVNQIANNFDNEPLVKEFNTINTGVNYLKSLGSAPTDDIARIYQFAKIMDPNSAVREGEYKTVQEYSTALLQRLGLNAKRVFENTGFLTTEARNFLNTTLQKRLDTAKAQFTNVKNQYDKRIEQAKKGEFNSLADYGATDFSSNTPSTAPSPSKFDYLQKDFTIEGKNVYLPRSVWTAVQDKDGLLKDVAGDGYKLLIR